MRSFKKGVSRKGVSTADFLSISAAETRIRSSKVVETPFPETLYLKRCI